MKMDMNSLDTDFSTADMDFSERRKHIRIYFAPSKELTGTLTFSGEEGETSCMVLDLSLGGLHLALEEERSLKKGEVLTMHGLHSQTSAISEEAITLEIRWVFSHPEFNRTYVGCEFSDLPEQSRKNIANLIGTTLKKASETA